jgi:oligosaccharide repeat unit polymerase
MTIWPISGLVFLLAILNYRYSRSVLYPPFIFCGMWLLVLCLYEANLIEIDPLHAKTLFLVGLGTVLFTLGGLIARLLPSRCFTTRITLGFRHSYRKAYFAKFAIIVLAAIGMVIRAYITIHAGMQYGPGSIFANARTVGLEGDTQTPSILLYQPMWINFAATLFLIEKKDRWFWLMTLIALVTDIFTTGRTYILQLFCMLTVAYLFRVGKLTLREALKFARAPIAIFILLFVGLVFLNKQSSAVEGGGILALLGLFVIGYIIGPLAAMDYVLQHPAEYLNEPNHTFKFLLSIGNFLHFWSYSPPPQFDAFLTVPFPVNTYTGYKFYFTDFGFWPAVLMTFLIAFLQTCLYRKARSGSELGLFLYAFSVFPLVMFIFDDIYSSFGEVLNALLFAMIFMAVRHVRLVPSGFVRVLGCSSLYPRSESALDRR